MISKGEILEYYKSQRFQPELPSNPNWRHFRGINIKGGWRKCQRIIKTPEQLKKWIIKEKLIDIWFSTSLWLDPRNIADRNEKPISEQILLGADLVFDIDRNFSIKGLKEAFNTTKKIYSVVSKDYKLKYFEFTGMKGFRLVFDYPTHLPKDPRKKIKFLEKNRKVYIDKSLLDIEIDRDCTIDAFRIIRIIGTVNSKSSLVCRKLPKSALLKSFDEIRKYIVFPNGKQAVIPLRAVKQEKEKSQKKKKPPQNKVKTGPWDAIFITNQVCKNRYTAIFKWPKESGYKRRLKRLHKIYDIGPVFVFEDEIHIYVYGIRTYQKRRLQKVYKASKSLLTNQFRKYRKNYFQVVPELKFKEKIDFKTKSYCSKAHYNYITSRGIKDNSKLRFHKDTILKLSKVKFKE